MYNNWIEENYKQMLCSLETFTYHKYRGELCKVEVKDIFNSGLLKVIESNSYKIGNIKDLKSYIWVTLRNEIVFYLNRRNKNNEIFRTIIDNDCDNSFIEKDELEYYYNRGFKILVEDLKKVLDHQEYIFFMNYTFNKLNYKEIAKLMGYSNIYVYKKHKEVFKKIKNYVNSNKERYM